MWFFRKTCQKLRFWDIWKSWFLILPCGVFNFNFYKKNITTPKTILAFQGVSHFSNKCSSTVYRRSALDLVGQFFLKVMLEGQKNFRGERGGSTMDDAMTLVDVLAQLVPISYSQGSSIRYSERLHDFQGLI